MKKIGIFLVMALLLGFASVAQATEATTLQIINNLLTLQRLDTIENQAELDTFLQDGETFLPGTFTVTGFGRQAGFTQQAYAYDASGTANVANLGSYSLFTSGKMLPYGSYPKITFSPAVEWGLKGYTTGGTFYSEASKNKDLFDHWKVYCLRSLGKGYDIAFAAYEDLTFNKSDFDYNDLVLKIEKNPNPVPLPGALLLLSAGMVRLVTYARRRRA